MTELGKRVIVGAIGIPLAMAIIYFGGYLFAAVVFIISAIALWEFYSLAEAKQMQPIKKTGIIFGLIMQLTLSIIMLENYNFELSYIILAELILFIMIIFFFRIGIGTDKSFTSLSSTVAGVLYIPFFLSFLIALRNATKIQTLDIEGLSQIPAFLGDNDPDAAAALLLISILFSIWICDSAAYFVGKAVGKHKLAPKVSPKKTWEGAIAGFVAGAASAVFFASLLLPEFPTLHAIMIGSIVGTIGQAGDLAESLLKRDAGVKDSSRILPGHGGFLDRFDSILFVMPAVFICLVLINI